ncbi:MAG TPA: class I lanthipeptide [Chitinophaga sp.]|uniref:class I lanthipeptide n=1 Tax=Chitinophaga sp. TaxID=1869181 RepID=UPI002B8BD906|nr:class I lanthipeptide [Chitinophaga sp.]HVI44508.1 class I lanthipeptide [Chitinophaga sp.]
MKRKKIPMSKKLIFDKKTIASLQVEQQNNLLGGATLIANCTDGTTRKPTACTGRPCC